MVGILNRGVSASSVRISVADFTYSERSSFLSSMSEQFDFEQSSKS